MGVRNQPSLRRASTRTRRSAPVAALCLLFTACGAPSAQPVLASPVGAMPSLHDEHACPVDEAGLELQQRARARTLDTAQATFRCAPDSPEAHATADVRAALQTLRARLAFLGAPPEEAVLGTDTLRATVVALPAQDYEALSAPGALSLHEVDEDFLRAVGQQPVPAALHAGGIAWDTAAALMAVPIDAPAARSAELLDAHVPVPNGSWVVMTREDSHAEEQWAFPVRAAGLSADDVQPCEARLDAPEGAIPGTRLRMNARGAERLAQLTERVQGRRVVVALDGLGLGAPLVREAIRGGAVTVSGPGAEFGRVSLALLQRPLPVRVACELIALE